MASDPPDRDADDAFSAFVFSGWKTSSTRRRRRRISYWSSINWLNIDFIISSQSRAEVSSSLLVLVEPQRRLADLEEKDWENSSSSPEVARSRRENISSCCCCWSGRRAKKRKETLSTDVDGREEKRKEERTNVEPFFALLCFFFSSLLFSFVSRHFFSSLLRQTNELCANRENLHLVGPLTTNVSCNAAVRVGRSICTSWESAFRLSSLLFSLLVSFLHGFRITSKTPSPRLSLLDELFAFRLHNKSIRRAREEMSSSWTTTISCNNVRVCRANKSFWRRTRRQRRRARPAKSSRRPMDNWSFYKALNNLNKRQRNTFKSADKVRRSFPIHRLHSPSSVLQLSNVQTSQQPQTITIPAGALQLGANGQQIVQLATPTKMSPTNQNGSVIMVKRLSLSFPPHPHVLDGTWKFRSIANSSNANANEFGCQFDELRSGWDGGRRASVCQCETVQSNPQTSRRSSEIGSGRTNSSWTKGPFSHLFPSFDRFSSLLFNLEKISSRVATSTRDESRSGCWWSVRSRAEAKGLGGRGEGERECLETLFSRVVYIVKSSKEKLRSFVIVFVEIQLTLHC